MARGLWRPAKACYVPGTRRSPGRALKIAGARTQAAPGPADRVQPTCRLLELFNSPFVLPELQAVGVVSTEALMKRLPPRPDLGHLKKQAKTLLAAARAGDAAALARMQPLALPAGTDLRLHHAQWCLAREHGFASWPQFQAFVLARRALADDPARAMLWWLRQVYAGDIAGGNHAAQPALAAQLLNEGAVRASQDL